MEYVRESERDCFACCLSGLVEIGESVHLFLSFQEVCTTHNVEGYREAFVGELCAWEAVNSDVPHGNVLGGLVVYCCSDMNSDGCQTLCIVCCGLVVLCWIG